MTTTLALIASGILIGAGISVIWRDVMRNRGKTLAFLLQRDLPVADSAREDVEITIAPAKARKPLFAYADLLSLVSGEPSKPEPEKREPTFAAATFDPPSPEREGLAAVEQQWANLEPVVAAGVAQVNTILSAASLTLGAQGKTSWSYKNRGYGAFRRLLMGEESLGWVRIELVQDGTLLVDIKAHKDAWAAINGKATAPAEGITRTAVSDLLAGCLKPAAARAAQSGVNSGGNGEAHAATAGDTPWQDVDGLVAAALKATNGALAQTGGRLRTLAPAEWDPLQRRHRMTLAVEVDAAEVARMQIERLPHEMEVAVGVRDAQMIGLGRRRRIPIEGMTIHSLYELMTGCAWPVIARFKDVRGEPAVQHPPFRPSRD
ncbi:MAG: hypothetical protein ABWY63_08150 [Hyphomicrobiaceae bacterium]